MNWKTNKKLPRKHYKSVEIKKKLRDEKDRTRSSISNQSSEREIIERMIVNSQRAKG